MDTLKFKIDMTFNKPQKIVTIIYLALIIIIFLVVQASAFAHAPRSTGERLAKRIARSGYCSRRAAEEIIKVENWGNQ